MLRDVLLQIKVVLVSFCGGRGTMWGEKSGASRRCRVQRCHGEGGYRANARRAKRFRGRLSFSPGRLETIEGFI